MNKKLLIRALAVSLICFLALIGVTLLANASLLKKNAKNGTPAPDAPVISGTVKEVYTDSKSFLNDKNFLDEDQPALIPEKENTKKEVKLLVSSVTKDIRVTIVDKYGRKIEGVPFYVDIEGVGEYKDLDMDGYLYIAGIKPGNYDVTLSENDNYKCGETMNIDVYDTVQYAALEDIMYSVVQEKDINVEDEDTRQNEVYRDDTENTRIAKTGDGVEVGIDVSAWQKDINWKKVKDAGVEFAILRCGYRGSKTGALVEDSYFYKNLTGAKEAGIKVGVYFFTQAITETEAVEEASMVLALVGDTELEYPIFIDTENTNGRADNIDKNTRTAVCDAFCKTIEKSGREAGIYASRNWFNNKLNDDKLSDHYRWVAEYASTTAYSKRYEMWQYTSSGSIDGIKGRVDLDMSYLDK